jgi:hypothetical protein
MTQDHSDRADELIAQAARDYNAPGPVPRDEIWNRIVEARRSAVPAQPIASPPRRTRYWIWPSVGVAAAGLVAFGVAIGRNVERTRVQAPLATLPRDSAATTPAPDRVATGLATDSAREIPATARTLDSASPNARSALLRPLALGDQSNSGSVAYRLAVVNHVIGSEAMITAFRASARRGEMDAQLAKWSHDLLGETRLLESSAPSDDVTMKRLLEDLELVLVQIVQYTNHGTHSPDDLDLIDRSIRRRGVMSNIRNVSAGQLPSGT